MVSAIPTRLELHRLKYRWSGGASGSLPVSSLTAEEWQVINEETMYLMLREFYDLKSARERVYAEWGVSF